MKDFVLFLLSSFGSAFLGCILVSLVGIELALADSPSCILVSTLFGRRSSLRYS